MTGAELRDARKAAKLSIKKAAELSGTPYRTWQNWEAEGKEHRRPPGIAFSWLQLHGGCRWCNPEHPDYVYYKRSGAYVKPVARQGCHCSDLLEACEAFVIAWEKSHQLEKTDTALRLAKAAIAKAKGATP